MPDRDVTSVGDLIYYQYAKIIAKSAFGVPEGREGKDRQYGFVKERLRELGRESRVAGGWCKPIVEEGLSQVNG